MLSSDEQTRRASITQTASVEGEPPARARVLHLADLRFRLLPDESANVHIHGIATALEQRVELLTPPCPFALAVLGLVSRDGRPRGAARLVELAGLLIGTVEMSVYALVHRVRFVYARHAMWLGPTLFLLRLARRAVVLEVNGLVATERRLAGGRRLGVISRLELAILRRASRIRCVSARLARELTDAGVPAERLFVEHNGVDERVFEIRPERSGDERLVGFIGSGQGWHHMPTLLDAFRIVVGEVPDARLIVAGPRRESLEAGIAARGLGASVELRGTVTHSEALAMFRRITVAVNPGSAPHHSPLKLFEAMALGKPIVAGRAEGICEILEHEVSALLVDQEDAAALASAIVRLLGDGALRRRIGDAARDEARARHTWQRVADVVVRAGEDASTE